MCNVPFPLRNSPFFPQPVNASAPPAFSLRIALVFPQDRRLQTAETTDIRHHQTSGTRQTDRHQRHQTADSRQQTADIRRHQTSSDSRDNRHQASSDIRHQTDRQTSETPDIRHHQTSDTRQTDIRQTPDRHQRHQTSETPDIRQQTADSRQQTADSRRHGSRRHGSRQQTADIRHQASGADIKHPPGCLTRTPTSEMRDRQIHERQADTRDTRDRQI